MTLPTAPFSTTRPLRRLRDLAQDRRGSNAVEFALIAPLFLTLLLTMVYLAIYLSVGHSLTQIAADASRYAMVGLDAQERKTLAKRWIAEPDRTYGLVRNSRLIITVSEGDGALRVALAYDMTELPTLPIVGAMISLPSRMERTTTVLVP